MMNNENEKFAGFEQPQQNFSKLPHAFINLLPVMQSKSELCIVLYILRHTWGYQEYEDARRISIDEFANGRKKRDGTRIDNGVGMSEPAIRAGIKAAIGHGFILVEVDDSDKARVEKFYKLNMVGENNLPPEREEGGKQFTPNGKKSTPDHRKKLEERNSQEIPTFPNKTSVDKADGQMLQVYFNANTDELTRMFKLNGKDLQFVPFANESLKAKRGMIWQHVQTTRRLAEHGATFTDYLDWLTGHFNWRKNGVTVNVWEFGDTASTFITARHTTIPTPAAPTPEAPWTTSGDYFKWRAEQLESGL